MVYFKEKKFENLIRSNISIFYFVEFAFSGISKKCLPNSKSQRFYSMLYSRSLSLLGFSFRFMTHFELTLVYDIKYR